MPLFGTFPDPDIPSVVGQAEAIFVENNHGKIATDWQSDVELSERDIALHGGTIRIYMRRLASTQHEALGTSARKARRATNALCRRRKEMLQTGASRCASSHLLYPELPMYRPGTQNRRSRK